jgi:hypothetical protein
MAGAKGKKPYVEDERDFKLTAVQVALPPIPTRRFGFGSIYSDWKVLGNDYYGDCVWAGADHETMLWNRLAGHSVSFTDDNALSDYSAVTGFNKNDPNSDQGTEVRTAMGYRRSTGVIDSRSIRHKIDAYVSIDPKDWDLMLRCLWAYLTVGVGFAYPTSGDKQFDNNVPWDVVSGATVEGGHYVNLVGSKAPTERITCISWGRTQEMTKEFYEKYNDETWIPLSKEELRAPVNVRNINWTKLSSMLSSL